MQEILKRLADDFLRKEGNIIALMQDAQEELGYISREAVSYFSKALRIPESRFYGIATFYSQFYLKPRGKKIVTACCGTACHVKGAERLISAAAGELGLADGQDTTEDGKITFEKVACLGTCSMAPVVVINKKVYGKMTPEKLKKEIKAIAKAD